MNHLNLCLAIAVVGMGTTPAAAEVHVHGERLALTFPDGERVEIDAKKPPAWRTVDKDTGSLAEILPALEQEAKNGDASAAWLLGSALEDCSFAYSDEKAMEAAIDHLQRTGELRPPGTDAVAPLAAGSNVDQAAEDLFRRPFRFCLGITDDQKAGASKWTKQAADLGYPPAALTFAPRLGKSDEAVRAYEIAWRAGRYDAAGQLAKLYQSGSPGARAPDPVKALAYLYIYHSITQHRLRGANTPIRSRQLQSSQQDLDRRLSEAQPETRESALRLAKKLLRENRNCCHGF